MAVVYGFITGIQSLPHLLIPQMAGALLGRYWLERRFGRIQWRRKAPVLLAGFACGQGLTGMGSVAIALIARSVAQLPY